MPDIFYYIKAADCQLFLHKYIVKKFITIPI